MLLNPRVSDMNFLRIALLILFTGKALTAVAQEEMIRKNLGESSPDFARLIKEVTATPMKGLYELRVNTADLYYTDAEGNFVIASGRLLDTRSGVDLTEERMAILSRINFKDLPLQDAFTIVRGNGERQLAVFEDPNCVFCKQLDLELAELDNVTLHIFLYPILGDDSWDKSVAVWCSEDRADSWEAWMLKGVEPGTGNCDAAGLERNLVFGEKVDINGTPTIIFADGSRTTGNMDAYSLEEQLEIASP